MISAVENISSVIQIQQYHVHTS